MRDGAPEIAIDARMAGHSGIGVYIRNIVPRLARLRPHWRFTLLGVPDDLLPVFSGDNVSILPCRAAIYSLSEQWALARAARHADLFWAPHYNAPLLRRGPMLVTIHDVNHLALDHGWGIRRLYATVLLQALRRRASGLCFASRFSRSEFERLVGRFRQPFWLTPGAVGDAWRSARSPPRARSARDYVVAVGSVKPHKNLTGLLDAFALIAPRFDVDLVIVGRHDGLRDSDDTALARIAEQAGRVRLAGALPDAALIDIVAGARALVFPSLYEGFGLPPLEAMAVGCPTVVSAIAPLTETCGVASEYVDPRDPHDMARGIAAVLGDDTRAAELRRHGHDQVRAFDWSRTAATVAEAMETIMAPTSRDRRSMP
ncbi:glycosyltransferase family 1 protein [Kaistia dalseonensis]|uniref:Glycosyltransferase involved in cell wall biosynthesis n=1 Tax=Kaistia dalseonensis TaxID=410840 RepID=A0ABU0HCY7_9HYPH|nr:glycosyltransferase family 1 protein [Kaistia dalseonensis]MCX5497543.1 glycosyltransferase family 1 protein [Kaistia dalseonensis]MDQ0440183.1 glycosyltransferase involved in cell wall biosynthesis [Kaistia dalseonensis]